MTDDVDPRPESFAAVRVDAWVQLAVALNADVRLARFGFSKVLKKRVGDWTIVLDRLHDPVRELLSTRVRAEFLNPEGFWFRIYSETPLTPAARLFHLVNDVESGERSFDESYVCESNDRERLRAIIQEPEVRRLIRANHKHPFWLEARASGLLARDKEVGVLEFSEQLPGNDLDALKNLFDLFAEVLDQICARGRAYADPIASTPWPTESSAAVQETYAAVARATVRFPGRPERQGDDIVARLMLATPEHAIAELRVTPPFLPANRCVVELTADLPGDAELSPPSGLLAGADIAVKQRLVIRHAGVPPSQLDGFIFAALDHWRRAVARVS